MDITQILITAGAIVGILVVALLAVVPTVMEIPAPERHQDRRPRPAPAATPARDDDFHLAA